MFLYSVELGKLEYKYCFGHAQSQASDHQLIQTLYNACQTIASTDDSEDLLNSLLIKPNHSKPGPAKGIVLRSSSKEPESF